MWEGGMDYYSLCYLDFFDTRKNVSVNLPPGYAIYPASAGGMYPVVPPAGVTLESFEKAYGYTADQIPAGEERWGVQAGSYLSIVKDGRELVAFAVPLPQGTAARIVQPTLGYGPTPSR